MKLIRTKTPTDHQAAAWACQTAAGVMPGTEVRINVYPERASAEAVARHIRTGNIRAYRPLGAFEAGAYPAEDGTAVWARYVDGLGLEPLPQTLTVRIPNDGRQAGYEAAHVVVEISARCLVCGGPRGELRPDRFRRDGVRHVRDVWDNRCGHIDEDQAVLQEARRREELTDAHVRREPLGGELRGVEGGRYSRAVDLIAERLKIWPWFSSLGAVRLLIEHGEHDAADALRAYRATSHSGANASGKGAALFLNYCDAEAARIAAGTTTTGDVK